MNSAHQCITKWTFEIRPRRVVPYVMVRSHCARFGRKAFGSATMMRISARPQRAWRVEVRTDGEPPTPAYVAWMTEQWTTFFVNGFGLGTTVSCETKLEAGPRDDGAPADQLVILPVLEVGDGRS